MPERGREWIKEAPRLEPLNQLLAKNYFFCALTPELSRAALRPWAGENLQHLHEAAKRARLERIVSRGPCRAPLPLGEEHLEARACPSSLVRTNRPMGKTCDKQLGILE